MSNQEQEIIWSEIYKRLEIAQTTIEHGLTPNSEEKHQILKARAKTLAQEPKEHKEKSGYIEVVEFLLAYEKYCIESSFISEIYSLKELTILPCVPNFVLGLINIHGRILSVIDIKKFFNLPEKGLTDLNKVIVVNTDEMELGILADVVFGVQEIPIKEIQPSLATLTGVGAEYLKGVTKERTIILDIKKILADKKIIINEQVEI